MMRFSTKSSLKDVPALKSTRKLTPGLFYLYIKGVLHSCKTLDNLQNGHFSAFAQIIEKSRIKPSIDEHVLYPFSFLVDVAAILSINQ